MNRCLSSFALLGCLPVAGCYWMIWDPEDADLSDTAVPVVVCGRGEIRSTVTGVGYDSLAAALEGARDQDEICLGAGDFTVGEVVWFADDGVDPSLSLIGAGSGVTRLVGVSGMVSWDGSTILLSGGLQDATVTMTGLTLYGVAAYVDAGRLAATDLVLYADGGSSGLARLEARDIEVQGLTVSDCGALGAVPVVLRGDGTLTDLVMTDNVLYPGYLLETYGELTLVDPVIAGNVGMSDEIGFQAIEPFGPLRIVGGELSRNSTNGPLIQAHDRLELDGVSIVDNDVPWRGVVSTEQDALVTGGQVARNRAGTGALELLEGSTLTIGGVDFGVEAEHNSPCDVAVFHQSFSGYTCVGTDLGAGASAVCDVSGCQ